jgi:hypothetical protein
MTGHPNTFNRSPRDADTTRVLACASGETLTWIEADLDGEPMTLQIARSVEHVVSALVEDPPPRATILVIDFDPITPPDLLQLHSIRERGWFGAIIGIGHVPVPLRTSLAIANVLARPLHRHALRNAISRAGVGLATTKIPRLDG